jgi:histidinol-phosphate aminotransferase
MYSHRFGRLTPYIPGEQPKDRTFIKLNTNETPYPPCPEIKELLERFPIEGLRLYPDPEAWELREVLAEYEQVPANRIFVSNGSDEALSFCFFSFFDETSGPVLYPRFTYSFYPVYCGFYNIPYTQIPLQSNFSLDLGRFIEAVPKSSGVIFPNPNAPTGRFEELAEISPLLREAGKGRAVVIDEAYIDFGGDTAVPLMETYPNLVVVKTLSKGFSLAGARLGYTVAGEEITSALFTVKDSFNSYPVDTLTQKIGAAALRNTAYYKTIQRKIMDTREKTREELTADGWQVLPSKANFLFARKPGTSGKEIYNRLREHNILVRRFDIPGIEDFLRVTVGTDDEMEQFLAACRQYIC